MKRNKRMRGATEFTDILRAAVNAVVKVHGPQYKDNYLIG
jgi:hypothetical protein